LPSRCEPGRGTAFEILLKRTNATAAPGSFFSRRDIMPQAEVLLLVEDDDTMRRLYAQALESRGYRVLTAADGFAALTTAATHPEPIRLLITDFVLPRMSGQELRIKFQAHHPDAQVLFLTGYAEHARAIIGDGPGVPRILAKPVGTETLVATVRMSLDLPAETGRRSA
jgi:DNA-binding response OmpR family regulator